MRQIASDGDMIWFNALQVAEQGLEHLTLLHPTSPQLPLQIPEHSLVHQFSYSDTIQRRQMEV